jgi:hypothetical protein
MNSLKYFVSFMIQTKVESGASSFDAIYLGQGGQQTESGTAVATASNANVQANLPSDKSKTTLTATEKRALENAATKKSSRLIGKSQVSYGPSSKIPTGKIPTGTDAFIAPALPASKRVRKGASTAAKTTKTHQSDSKKNRMLQ